MAKKRFELVYEQDNTYKIYDNENDYYSLEGILLKESAEQIIKILNNEKAKKVQQKKEKKLPEYKKIVYDGYPIVTEENFEEVYYSICEKDGWDTKLNIKPPSNNNEFKEATKNLYGVALTAKCKANTYWSGDGYHCLYEIIGEQDKYSRGKIYQLWEQKLGQYDGLQALLYTTFGSLSCGGVAGHHYGQTKCNKETWERVNSWN